LQTFLPYANFDKSCWCLDYRRLGKQRVEAAQILATHGVCIKRPNGEFFTPTHVNHPIHNIWKNHLEALKQYYNLCISEWVSRGYRNNLEVLPVDLTKLTYPPLVGYEPFHASHRSNLLRKKPDFYAKYNWKEPDNLAYVWTRE